MVGILIRAAELLLAALSLAIGALTLYVLIADFRSDELAWGSVRENWGLFYLLGLLICAVLLVGARLAVPRLRPAGRVIGRAGLGMFGVLYTILFLTTWWAEGRLPPAAWPMLVGAVGGALYGYFRYWRAEG